MAIITIQGLTKRFGPVVAVDDLSFEVDQGTVVGFLGPNGAGKTTTLRMLLGLVSPTAGSARIDGKPYRELADPVRHVGAVLEASSFHPGRSARNHLRVVATAAGLPLARADEVLAQVGLATALLGDPQVLILDEPANGLDPEGVHWLRGLLRQLADQGRTVLVSSHLLAEVAQTVDQHPAGGRPHPGGDGGHGLLLCPRPACSSRPITSRALNTARRYEAGSLPSSAAG